MKIPIFGKPIEYTLKFAGLWPDCSNIFGFMFIVSGMFLIIPFQVWDIVKELHNKILVLDHLSTIVTEIMLYSKFLALFYHRRVFRSLLREMAEDYENVVKMEYWSKLIVKAHRFLKYDYAIYTGANLTYYLQFILIYPVTPVEHREMLLGTYYPFDFKSSPVFEIITFIHIVQGLIMCSIQSLTESLLVALVLHVCGHIDLLSEKIEDFSASCTSNQTNVSLAPLIKQHLKILNIVRKVEAVYTYVAFVQVFLSTLMIGFTGFTTLNTMDDPVIMCRFLMLCVIASWQAYSFCFSGQRLINKSEKISNKIYETFWYHANPKEIRAISYIISRAQSPLKLTAGKFTSLSARTFTSIIKTSFSYFSVLRACNF